MQRWRSESDGPTSKQHQLEMPGCWWRRGTCCRWPAMITWVLVHVTTIIVKYRLRDTVRWRTVWSWSTTGTSTVCSRGITLFVSLKKLISRTAAFVTDSSHCTMLNEMPTEVTLPQCSRLSSNTQHLWGPAVSNAEYWNVILNMINWSSMNNTDT